MNTLELFCGTKSFSKVAMDFGYTTYTVDNELQFNPSWCVDVLEIETDNLPYYEVIWASPPCQAFSVAAIGKNWDKDTRLPKSESANLGLKLMIKTTEIIKELKPRYWFIENPRGMMRKVIEKYLPEGSVRHTVTYCQYGDTRMKPTDIWTNCKEWKPRPPCKNGMSCHISAPRGARTGTQGIKGAKDRGVIPPELFKEIFTELKSPSEE